MTKKQKIWLWVFLGMFLLPEILWSPITNSIYELYLSGKGNTHPFRFNFLNNPDFANTLSAILFIQMLGLVFTFIYLISVRGSIKNKLLLWTNILISLLMAVIVFFLFGFSISLRHIGF